MFRFATLNLLNFAAPPAASYEWDNIYTASQWQQKTSWLQRQLTVLAPDIMAVQEVFSIDVLAQLVAPLGYQLAVAATPKLRDQHIFEQPVVALLSRYPILACQQIEADATHVAMLGLTAFAFSRPPLWVQLELPGFGKLSVVVVHLKSRRKTELSEPLLAHWQAQQQRALEAVLLRQLLPKLAGGGPLLVAGDFNDELTSDLLQPLLAVETRQSPLFMLQDAAQLAPPGRRPPTHYYGAHGKVLDYMLLSAEFDPRHHHSLAEVTHYHVEDQHLVRPDFAKDGYSSDHALVQITIQSRR